MVEPAWASAFAARWADWWNRRDLDSLLACYADDAMVQSPAAARLLPGSNGILRGKPVLREFWTTGLRLVPDLRFEVVTVFTGCDAVVLNHRDQNGRLGADTFLFADGLIVEAIGAVSDSWAIRGDP